MTKIITCDYCCAKLTNDNTPWSVYYLKLGNKGDFGSVRISISDDIDLCIDCFRNLLDEQLDIAIT